MDAAKQTYAAGLDDTRGRAAQVVVVQNTEWSPGPVENSHTTSTPPGLVTRCSSRKGRGHVLDVPQAEQGGDPIGARIRVREPQQVAGQNTGNGQRDPADPQHSSDRSGHHGAPRAGEGLARSPYAGGHVEDALSRLGVIASTTSFRQARSAPRDKASLAMSYPAATRSHIAATSADRLAKMALDSLRFGTGTACRP
jgi:hypothetical protein